MSKAMAIFVLFIVVVVLALSVYNTIVVGNSDDNIDHLTVQVDRVEEFVDELEEQTPEESERNRAITEAVNQVPQIRSILCEAFPEASACVSLTEGEGGG